MDGAVPTIGDVQVRGSARLLRQKSCQVRCIADAQFFDVCRTIRVHWIGTGLFSGRNVRASDDDSFDFGRCARCQLCRRRNRLSENLWSDQQINADSSGKGRLTYSRGITLTFIDSCPTVRVWASQPTKGIAKCQAKTRKRYSKPFLSALTKATIFSKPRIAAQRIPQRAQAQVAISVEARSFGEGFKLPKRQFTFACPGTDDGKAHLYVWLSE